MPKEDKSISEWLWGKTKGQTRQGKRIKEVAEDVDYIQKGYKEIPEEKKKKGK